ncbi:hypothetical protein BGZ63DRAFT_449357 [Mariannaea sp. PMI_226]|nr:hypothetical protein BGZ63DRAFT_449357 [Mariannaea sp. PMI_226]
MAKNLFGLVAILLATTFLGRGNALALANSRWQCQNFNHICVSSFKSCTSSRDPSGGLLSPTETYMWNSNRKGNINSATVFWENVYCLTWAKADISYPILLEWEFGDSENRHCWSRNFTSREASFEFSFEGLAEIVAADIGIIAYRALSQTSSLPNIIKLSQPESPSKPEVVSDQFFIVNSKSRIYLREEQGETTGRGITNVWKIAVGTGVGIGAVFGLAFIVGYFLRRGRKGSSKSPTQQGSEEDRSPRERVLNSNRENEVVPQPGTQTDQQTKDGEEQAREASAKQARAYYR